MMYANLDKARRALDTELTGRDDELMEALRSVSQRVDLLFAAQLPVFAPYLKTRTLVFAGNLYSPSQYTVRLPWPLLELDSVAVKTPGSSSYATLSATAWPTDEAPIHELYLASWASYYGSGRSLLQVAGVWGQHDDYENAWDSVDALVNSLNAESDEISLVDVDGANSWGETPRLSPGDMLRIDDEYMEVLTTTIAESSGPDAATVRRAVNGTSAAAHDAGKAIEVYRPPEALSRAVARQAAMWVSRRGAFETAVVGDFGVTQYPSDLLNELLGTVNGLSYVLRR